MGSGDGLPLPEQAPQDRHLGGCQRQLCLQLGSQPDRAREVRLYLLAGGDLGGDARRRLGSGDRQVLKAGSARRMAWLHRENLTFTWVLGPERRKRARRMAWLDHGTLVFTWILALVRQPTVLAPAVAGGGGGSNDRLALGCCRGDVDSCRHRGGRRREGDTLDRKGVLPEGCRRVCVSGCGQPPSWRHASGQTH